MQPLHRFAQLAELVTAELRKLGLTLEGFQAELLGQKQCLGRQQLGVLCACLGMSKSGNRQILLARLGAKLNGTLFPGVPAPAAGAVAGVGQAGAHIHPPQPPAAFPHESGFVGVLHDAPVAEGPLTKKQKTTV